MYNDDERAVSEDEFGDDHIFDGVRHFYVLTKNGRCLKLCRETYLRRNLPCRSGLCRKFECRQNSTIFLPSDVSHYLLPDARTLLNFYDVLDICDAFDKGLIISQSVVRTLLREKGRKFFNQLREKIRNSEKSSVAGTIIFLNELHADIFLKRDPTTDDNLENYYFRLLYRTAEFYCHHLNENGEAKISIILLTENEDLIRRFAGVNANIFVCSLGDYLRIFSPQNVDAQDLYDTAKKTLNFGANQETQNSLSKGSRNFENYDAYLSPAIWNRGVRTRRLFVGIIRVNKRKFRQAYVTLTNRELKNSDDFILDDVAEEISQIGADDEDILIDGIKDRNRAVNGDEVVVEIYPKNLWASETRAQGKVVAVAKRNWRDYVCTPQDDSENFRSGRVLVIPYDIRIPKIGIFTSNGERLKNQRLLVRLFDDCWPANSQYPTGRCVRILGPINDLETEMNCLTLEHNIRVEAHSSIADSEARNAGTNFENLKAEILESGRSDLRTSHLIFSIDPPGCQDVDDALSVKILDSDRVELGVHIADVSYFVEARSQIDREAAERATTVYLADRRYDMLPSNLATDLCSLWSGKDRYAVSVFWTLNKRVLSEVLAVRFERTLIRSKYKLEYEQAQAIFENRDEDKLRNSIPELSRAEENFSDLKTAIEWLVKIAKALHDFRHGLELENVEVRVKIDPQAQHVESILPKPPLLMHEVIAECMIFANCHVAKRIYESFPVNSLLRRHPAPSEKKLRRLKDMASSKGFVIDFSSNKALAESLEKAVDADDPIFNSILKQMAVYAMQQAEYFSSGAADDSSFAHYGLNVDFYTHFTSPIRRYADLIVHRQLLWTMKKENDEENPSLGANSLLPNGWEYIELVDHLNERHRAAQHAESASTEYFQAQYFKRRSDNVLLCVVCGVAPEFLTLYAPKYGLKSQCFLQKADETAGGKKGNTDRKTWKLFDRVRAKIVVVESLYHAPQLQFELSENEPLKSIISEDEEQIRKRQIVSDVTAHLKQLKIDPLEKEDSADEKIEEDCEKTVKNRRDRRDGKRVTMYEFWRTQQDFALCANEEL